MEKLWSPWRSKYIESFGEKNKNNQCIFCAALNSNPESDDSLVVYKSSNCFVVLNLYPYNNGHLMLVPNRHINQLSILNEKENSDIFFMTNLMVKAISRVMNPEGFNFGANIGKAAGAGIDTHLHFHLVPRWTGDTNFMPVIGEVKVISQDLLTTKKKLQKAVAEILLDE